MTGGVAWVEWVCGCDQTANTVQELPPLCPGHAAHPVAPPELLPDEPDNRIDIGHWCPRRRGVRTPCPTGGLP